MQVSPFITSNTEDTRVLFENFGLTFYYAQLLEDDLKLILCAGEVLGLVSFDRKKDLKIKAEDEDLLSACMGALKQVLIANRKPSDNDVFYRMLDEANAARRFIAHRFFVEHALDLQSASGRAAVNQHLSQLYVVIRQAHTISKALREEMFATLGFTREMATKRLDELKKIIDEP
jgi:hypothetical protein